MLMCVTYLAFVGTGINFLLTALFPAWRGNDPGRWKLFNLINLLPDLLDSFVGQLRFARFGLIKRKPSTTRDFDERSAVILYYVFAAVFLFLGISGLVLVVYQSTH